MASTGDGTAGTAIDEQQARAIGVEAYIYLYPLVTMDVTRRQVTNIGAGKMPGRGPMNTFTHVREFPAADFRDVVRPNFDTLYSSAWLDLTDGPMVVSAADTDGRYYLLPMLDMWTDVFATPGKRTSGTGPQSYAIVPPRWAGTLPAAVERIESPTPYVWIIGRTQANGPADYQAVNKLQDGYTIAPLAAFGGEPGPVGVEIDPSVDMITPPLAQVNSMSAAEYFAYAAKLMMLHPPHLSDWSQLARARTIGLTAGREFDPDALTASVRSALEGVPAAALEAMRAKLATVGPVFNNWLVIADSIGVYGDYYLKRAIVAMVGLGANQPEDAIYPLALADGDGQPLTGDNDYVVHFDADALPPVDAFWSVTMYDSEGFQAANEIDRFAIGDRDPLHYNDDGSLDLYLQHRDPGDEKRANWLPAPRGALGVTMRLYAPQPPALLGSWTPPPVKRMPV
jgi:hypothetical protein